MAIASTASSGSAPYDDIPAMPDLSDLDEDERRSRTDDVHSELVHFLTHSPQMRQAARSSLRHSLWAGGGALAGSFLLGPAGGLVGGVAGSLVGYFKADEYDGMVLAVLKLEARRRDRVVVECWDVLRRAGATAQQLESSEAFRETIVRLAEREEVRDGIWRACVQSVRDAPAGPPDPTTTASARS